MMTSTNSKKFINLQKQVKKIGENIAKIKIAEKSNAKKSKNKSPKIFIRIKNSNVKNKYELFKKHVKEKGLILNEELEKIFNNGVSDIGTVEYFKTFENQLTKAFGEAIFTRNIKLIEFLNSRFIDMYWWSKRIEIKMNLILNKLIKPNERIREILDYEETEEFEWMPEMWDKFLEDIRQQYNWKSKRRGKK